MSNPVVEAEISKKEVVVTEEGGAEVAEDPTSDGGAEVAEDPTSDDSNSFQDCTETVDDDVAALTAGLETLEVAKDFSIKKLNEHFTMCLVTTEELDLEYYLNGYREVYKFLTLLGSVFTWVAADVGAKIDVLHNYNTGNNKDRYKTIKQMIDFEVAEELVQRTRRDDPSGTRTLLRLHRALEFVVMFLGKVDDLEFEDKCAPIARESYDATLSKHHIWPIRKGAAIAMSLLPTKTGLVHKVNPDSASDPTLVRKIESDFVVAVDSMRKVYDAMHVYYIEKDLLELP